MSLFSFDTENLFPVEDISTVAKFLPKNTKAFGKITKATAKAKFRDENDPKNPNTIWTQLTLLIEVKAEDGATPFSEIIDVDRVTLPYQIYVPNLTRSGFPLKSGNVDFGKLLEAFEISATDSFLKDGIEELNVDNFESPEAYHTEVARMWWENLGKLFVEKDFLLECKIGVRDANGNFPKANVISNISVKK